MSAENQPSVAEPVSCRAVTWRSVLLSAVGVMLLAWLAPFNDYAVENTYMVGSYLPLFVVMWVLVLVVFVNAPLHRFAPGHALNPAELTVILAATLAASAIPGQGMLRQLMALPVAFHYRGVVQPDFGRLFESMGLPDWLFAAPVDGEGRASRVVSAFYSRVQDGESIPYDAWIVPLLAWGFFAGCVFAAMIALSAITRHQWAENERLPFPLAQLQAMLIEPPAPGRVLNRLFRSWGFWIAAVAVTAIHSSTALNRMFPQSIPAVPLGFDFRPLMTEPPLAYLSDNAKNAVIYFTFVGVVYFIPAKVAFSLWFFFLAQQLTTMQFRVAGGDVSERAWMCQHSGAAFALLLGILWIGRHHWSMVVAQMFRRPRVGEPVGYYVRYRTAGWLLVASVLGMFGWLLLVGVTWWFAALIVAVILLAHLVTARIVAQTGLPFIRTQTQIPDFYSSIPASTLSGRDVFMSGVTTMLGPITTRESLMPFVHTAMQTTEQVAPQRSARRAVILAVVLALGLAFVVAAWSHLRVYYLHSMPLTISATGFENPDALENWPVGLVAGPVLRHDEGRFPPTQHDPLAHFGIGAVVMGGLQWASLSFPNWPLAPVGYLTANTFYIRTAWFSLLIGWAVKVAVVRFGGARLYNEARPVFVGLIFGEAIAAGIWMVVTLSLVSMGYAVERVRLLPQ
jgi:hypothetical protein